MAWSNITFTIGAIFTATNANQLQENARQSRINHYGGTTPANLEVGVEWWDTSGTYPTKKFYTGSNWVPMLFYDPSQNEGGIAPNGDSWGTVPMTITNGERTDFTGPLYFPKNMLLNGAMNYWQRGNSYSIKSYHAYTADRWMIDTRGSFTVAVRQSSENPLASPSRFSLQLQIANPQVTLNSGNILSVVQPVEGLMASRTLYGTGAARRSRLSCYVWSNVTGRLSFFIQNASRDSTVCAAVTYNVASVWQQVQAGINAPVSSNWATDNGVGAWVGMTFAAHDSFRSSSPALWVYNSPDVRCASGQLQGASTSGTIFRVTDLQWELGEMLTPFDAIPPDAEINLLQRYFIKTFDTTVAPRDGTGQTEGSLCDMGSDNGHVLTRWPFKMRTGPTVTFYNPRSGSGAGAGRWFNAVDNTDAKGGLIYSYGDSGIIVTGSGSGVGHEGKKMLIHAAADAELY